MGGNPAKAPKVRDGQGRYVKEGKPLGGNRPKPKKSAPSTKRPTPRKPKKSAATAKVDKATAKAKTERGRKRAVAFRKGHYYEWCGVRYDSVTRIIKTLSSEALVSWAANMVAKHVYTLCVMKEAGRLTGPALFAQLQDTNELSKAPYRYRNDKRDLGSASHKIAEAISLGQQIDPQFLSPELRPYTLSLTEWLEANRPTVEATECTVINRTHGYAGTLDWLMAFERLLDPFADADAVPEFRPRRILVDQKTSKDTYVDHCFQLTAYRNAEFIPLPRSKFGAEQVKRLGEELGVVIAEVEDGWELPMPETDGGAILLLKPHEARLMEWPTGPEVFHAFLSLYDVFRFLESRPEAIEISPVQTIMKLAEASATPDAAKDKTPAKV